MPPAIFRRLIAMTLLIVTPTLFHGQVQRKVITADSDVKLDTPAPHPLSWWTKSRLRDENGRIVTRRGERVEQKVSYLGAISGHRIVQTLTTIHSSQTNSSDGAGVDDLPEQPEQPEQWKSLLVQVGTQGLYEEIYRLEDLGGLFATMKSAAIYGTGPDAILGTYDPDTGNGGGCEEGYWWFDKAGAHEVNFSPLLQAINRIIPENGTYVSSCWALNLEKSELQSWVQKEDAECHACGGLGNIYAQYKIEHGTAIPVSVRFTPEERE
ncbi:MAG TPA: hypothetical protein VGB94_07295 [Acidobacteriaceae bacterium]